CPLQAVSRTTRRIHRRTFLRRSLAVGPAVGVPMLLRASVPSHGPRHASGPAIIQSPVSRPQLPQGIAAGDAGAGRAIIWSRCDRAARMFVEYDTTDRFTNARRVPGPAALAPSDHPVRVVLADLPAGPRLLYRVLFRGRSRL